MEKIVFEWEKQVIKEMLQHIQGCTLHKENEDKWVWRGGTIQEYTSKSTYKNMQNGTIGDEKTLEYYRVLKLYPQLTFFNGEYYIIG